MSQSEQTRRSGLGRRVSSFAHLPDVKGLIDADMPALQKVAALQRELYRSLPTGAGNLVRELPLSASYEEIAGVMQGGDHAVRCVGAALAFQRALETIGLRAWTLHYGFVEGATYALNIVEVDNIPYVHDCYFNEHGRVNLFEMLSNLDAGSAADFEIEERDRKPYLAMHCEDGRSRANVLETADAAAAAAAADTADTADVADAADTADAKTSPRNGGLARFTISARMHRKRAGQNLSEKCSETLRSLGLPLARHFLLLNPISVFDGTRLFSNAREMPLIGEWIAQGGRTLDQRSAKREAAGEEASGHGESPLGEQEGAARLRRERRAWFAQRLDLESSLDAATHDAELWRMRHDGVVDRLRRAKADLVQLGQRHAAGRSDWLQERLKLESGLDEAKFEANLWRTRHEQGSLRLKRADQEMANLREREAAERAALAAQLSEARSEAEQAVARIRADEARASSELARVRGVLARSRYLAFRRWMLRTIGRSSDAL